MGHLGGGGSGREAAEGGGGPGDRALEVQSLGAMACTARGDQTNQVDDEQGGGAVGDRHGGQDDCKLVACGDTGADEAKGGAYVEDGCLEQWLERMGVWGMGLTTQEGDDEEKWRAVEAAAAVVSLGVLV